MSYTHLTRDERYQIAILVKAGHDKSDIAQVMNRPLHDSPLSPFIRITSLGKLAWIEQFGDVDHLISPQDLPE